MARSLSGVVTHLAATLEGTLVHWYIGFIVCMYVYKYACMRDFIGASIEAGEGDFALCSKTSVPLCLSV